MFESADTQRQTNEHTKPANLSFADVHTETPAKPNQSKNDEPIRLEPVPTTAKGLAERIVGDVYSVLRSPDDQKYFAQLQQDAQAIMVKPEVPAWGAPGSNDKVTDANAQFRSDVSKALPDAIKNGGDHDKIMIDEAGRILARGDQNIIVRNDRQMFQTRQLKADAAEPATVLDIGSPWAGPEKPSHLAAEIQKDVNTLIGSWAGQPNSDNKAVGADLIKHLNLLAPKINKEFADRMFSREGVDDNADYRSAVRDELAKIESAPQFVPLPSITINDRGDLEAFDAPFLSSNHDSAKVLRAQPDSNPDMPPDHDNQPWVISIGK